MFKGSIVPQVSVLKLKFEIDLCYNHCVYTKLHIYIIWYHDIFKEFGKYLMNKMYCLSTLGTYKFFESSVFTFPEKLNLDIQDI